MSTNFSGAIIISARRRCECFFAVSRPDSSAGNRCRWPRVIGLLDTEGCRRTAHKGRRTKRQHVGNSLYAMIARMLTANTVGRDCTGMRWKPDCDEYSNEVYFLTDCHHSKPPFLCSRPDTDGLGNQSAACSTWLLHCRLETTVQHSGCT